MNSTTDRGPKIIVALDYANEMDALALVDRLDPSRCRLKVGKEMFTRSGPHLVEKLVAKDFELFLDLKFHDIPNTVAGACRSAAELGVWMINVHALGGRKMMEAAADAVAKSASQPLLVGVTILTSMAQEDIAEVGLTGTPADNVQRLALLAESSGLNGVVCSPKETGLLRQHVSSEFNLVTPGIRPAWAEKGDQSRITTPADAVKQGADYLVIGRPITAADDPMSALQKIENELSD